MCKDWYNVIRTLRPDVLAVSFTTRHPGAIIEIY